MCEYIFRVPTSILDRQSWCFLECSSDVEASEGERA
jgi:hypothetical protein